MAKSLKKSSDSGNHLPYEMIIMILARLPAKSLLQMKLICSLWCSMISSPQFIKSHLDTANHVHNLRLRRYISRSPTGKSIGLKDEETRYERTIPATQFSQNVEFLGSCNGLLLLGDEEHTYYLWNPSTGLLRKFLGPSLFRGQFRNFALGYDATSSTYKAVRIVRVSSPSMVFRPPQNNRFYYDATSVRLYNCKTDTWKKIEDFPYFIFEDAQGITVNGAPHWVMYRVCHGEDKVLELVIVYFDLAEEKFKEIPKPDWLVHNSVFEFGAFEGRLCLLHYVDWGPEVWVIKKYGQESWADLSSELDVSSVRLPGWNSGRKIQHHSVLFTGPTAFARATYVESLVSPHGGSDMIG